MSIDIKEKIISPCIKVCKPNWKGYCAGCYRNILEITHWATMSDDERRRTMAEIPKRKEVIQFGSQKTKNCQMIP
jgi:hypothetical protein